MGERRRRRTVDPVRGKPRQYRVRASFDRCSVMINDIDPVWLCDKRLPLYRYLSEGYVLSVNGEIRPHYTA